MQEFLVGDIVIYKKDIEKRLYFIKQLNGNLVILEGINYRIVIEVDSKDIDKAPKELIDKEEIRNSNYKSKLIKSLERNKNNYILGKILHFDGDQKYLNKCLELYREMGVYAFGVQSKEECIYEEIEKYIYEVNPDIIVITGHDFFTGENKKDLGEYKNTKNFIKAIKEVRKRNHVCCIIAGACQSNFEALIANGADFASSPGRINIHVYDPAIIAINVATTSFRKIVDVESIYKYIENGRKAFGGVQTTGKMKIIL